MSNHNDLEQNISNLEFRIDELESSEYFSKKEVEDNFITREEVKILINRYEEKLEIQSNRISHLQKDVAICKENNLLATRKIKSNRQQIDALYNIQNHGKPY
jgi:chromosome segregation ATPase